MGAFSTILREIRCKKVGSKICRRDLLYYTNGYNSSYIDKYKKLLVDCGYLFPTEERGTYIILMHPRKTMTALSLIAEAKRMKWKIISNKYHNIRVSLQLRSLFKSGGWTKFYTEIIDYMRE